MITNCLWLAWLSADCTHKIHPKPCPNEKQVVIAGRKIVERWSELFSAFIQAPDKLKCVVCAAKKQLEVAEKLDNNGNVQKPFSERLDRILRLALDFEQCLGIVCGNLPLDSRNMQHDSKEAVLRVALMVEHLGARRYTDESLPQNFQNLSDEESELEDLSMDLHLEAVRKGAQRSYKHEGKKE